MGELEKRIDELEQAAILAGEAALDPEGTTEFRIQRWQWKNRAKKELREYIAQAYRPYPFVSHHLGEE